MYIRSYVAKNYSFVVHWNPAAFLASHSFKVVGSSPVMDLYTPRSFPVKSGEEASSSSNPSKMPVACHSSAPESINPFFMTS